jgi:hypothetical protein
MCESAQSVIIIIIIIIIIILSILNKKINLETVWNVKVAFSKMFLNSPYHNLTQSGRYRNQSYQRTFSTLQFAI